MKESTAVICRVGGEPHRPRSTRRPGGRQCARVTRDPAFPPGFALGAPTKAASTHRALASRIFSVFRASLVCGPGTAPLWRERPVQTIFSDLKPNFSLPLEHRRRPHRWLGSSETHCLSTRRVSPSVSAGAVRQGEPPPGEPPPFLTSASKLNA